MLQFRRAATSGRQQKMKNIDKKEGEGMASKQEAMWMRERERARTHVTQQKP
jgi:hypothetical protein